MASFTLSREDVFPNGTSVSAYAVVGEGRTPTSGAPPGSAVSTGSVTGGSVTLSGLADSTKYFAYAASPDRYLRFSTPPPETAQSGSTGLTVSEDRPADPDAGAVWLRIASNGMPTGELEVFLETAAPAEAAPNFTSDPVITGTGVVGATLTCDGGIATGNPTPTKTYQWKRDGVNISGATAATHNVVSADIGAAMACDTTATNTGGTDTATSNTITGLAAPTAPGAPTSLILTPGDASIAASWTAPASNGGSAITTYLVEYRTPNGSGSYTTFVHGASTTPSITITGLVNASAYGVRVSAVNAIGTGSPTSEGTATPVSSGVPEPDDIFGSDLYAWHRASDLAGSDGTSLASWPDTSGHSRDLAQGTTANKPVLKTAIVNGKAVVRFDATNDSIAATYGTPLAQPWAVLAVLKVASQPGGTVQLWDGGSATVALVPEGDGSISVDFSAGSHIFDSHDTGVRAWHSWAFIGNNASSDIVLDGTAVAASHSAGTASLSQMILNDYVGGGYATGMDVAEWVVIKRVPTGGDLTAWTTYCQAQYGTP